MNDRDLTAKYEEDDPVETSLISIEQAGSEIVEQAFNPHGGMGADLRDSQFQKIVKGSIDNGDLEAYKAVYQTYIPTLWVNDTFARQRTGNETFGHQSRKIACAQFLDHCGHEIHRYENELYDGSSDLNREWIYIRCFENQYGSKRADVTCDCDSHTLACEAGRTSAEKFSSHGESKPDTLVVCPYSSNEDRMEGGEKYRIYIFQKPDADLDWLSINI